MTMIIKNTAEVRQTSIPTIPDQAVFDESVFHTFFFKCSQVHRLYIAVSNSALLEVGVSVKPPQLRTDLSPVCKRA